MKTQTKIWTVGAATVAIGFSALTYKANAAVPERGPLAMMLDERLAGWGITDAQREQLRAVMKRHSPVTRPLVKEYVTARRALRDAIRSEQFDEAAIRAQSAKVAAVAADLAVERARIVADVRPILTSEQITKLKELRAGTDDHVDTALERIAKRIAE